MPIEASDDRMHLMDMLRLNSTMSAFQKRTSSSEKAEDLKLSKVALVQDEFITGLQCKIMVMVVCDVSASASEPCR
jgi:hypothetical protein